MMYEAVKEVREPVAECVSEAKPIAPILDDTIDALVEIHGQLDMLAEFLFGEPKVLCDRPETKCLEDSVNKGNIMTRAVIERINAIKARLGA